jgi:glycosyltransferase involved in cell wall biosynthesis
MKIIFVRTANKISGAEIYNLNLLSSIKDRREVKVTLVTNLKRLSDRMLDCGVSSVTIEWAPEEVGTKKQLLKIIFLSPIFIIKYLKMIRQMNLKRSIDIICFESMTEKIFLTPVLCLFGYKIIWIEHGPLFISQAANIIKYLYRYTSKYVKKIISVSKGTSNDLISGGINPTKIQTLYIGIDTFKFKHIEQRSLEKRQSLGISINSRVIGYVGTVTKEKGLEEIVSLSRELIRRSKDYVFLIIGDGPDLNWMKNEVNYLGLTSNYRFTGFTENVAPIFDVLDVFFFPTRHHEGISLSLLEALSMSKITIVKDIGGNSEVIQNNRNGYLFHRFNSVKIADLIQIFFAESKNFINIKKNAAKTIDENFNIVKQGNEFIKLFQSV